jgi:hypothetical protein
VHIFHFNIELKPYCSFEWGPPIWHCIKTGHANHVPLTDCKRRNQKKCVPHIRVCAYWTDREWRVLLTFSWQRGRGPQSAIWCLRNVGNQLPIEKLSLDPWRLWHYVPSKRRESITHWRCIISQKKWSPVPTSLFRKTSTKSQFEFTTLCLTYCLCSSRLTGYSETKDCDITRAIYHINHTCSLTGKLSASITRLINQGTSLPTSRLTLHHAATLASQPVAAVLF